MVHLRTWGARDAAPTPPGPALGNPLRSQALSAALVGLLALVLSATAAHPGSLEAVIKDADGKPVADAVVSAVATSVPRPALRPARATVEQVNREFVPFVRAVVVSSDVSFPNRDAFRHHVYSFSPARKFELPLHQGTEAPPVKFDKTGVVVLGCNIHDSMLGYVYVLETPWFETTGETGHARLADLPAGTYEVRVWHPRLPDGNAPAGQRVTIAPDRDERVELGVRLDPDSRPRRAPSRSGTRYR